MVQALAAQPRLLWVSVGLAKVARAKDRSIKAGLVKMVAVKAVCPHWNVRAA